MCGSNQGWLTGGSGVCVAAAMRGDGVVQLRWLHPMQRSSARRGRDSVVGSVQKQRCPLLRIWYGLRVAWVPKRWLRDVVVLCIVLVV